MPVGALLRELPPAVRAVQDDLSALAHVLWIGGPPGAGKTPIAQALAGKHDLRVYNSDARTWAHHDAALARGFPAAARWESMTPDEHWLGALDDMVELSLAANEERCRLMVEDLEALPATPLVLAEGTPLFPWLIADRMAGPDHGVWLIPSEEFQRTRLEEREHTSWDRTSDPPRAVENRIRRERGVGELIEEGARSRGFRVLAVDGTRDLAEMTSAVEALFAEIIAAGPRADTEAGRRALRRDDNLVVFQQVSTYLERVPEAGDPNTSTVPFACECGTSGCEAMVETPLAEAQRVFGGSGFLVALGHERLTR